MAGEPFFIKLGDHPRISKIHVWADYIELLALTSEDSLFSGSVLEDTLAEAEDTAIDQEAFELDEPMPSDEPDVMIVASEAVFRKWADIRGCLISRQRRLGGNWPFVIEDDILSCTIDRDNPSIMHRLYVALLIASSLRYINTTYRTEITSSLEYISYFVFKKILPESWVVRPFGAHQRIANGYDGILYEKFVRLSEDLNAKLMLEEDDLDPRDTGDGGIDLVAWHPLGDDLGNIPIAFAQCGCSYDDLAHKQFEANAVNLSSKIVPQHPGANYYFAPHDLRKNTGKWDKKPGQVIMLDRTRIIHLANTYAIEEEIVNWPHIETTINVRRAVIA